MRRFIFLFLLFNIVCNTFAQNVTLTGTVTDEDGAMLPYVSVVAQMSGVDSSFVTVTDGDGRYNMTVCSGDSCHVKYSFIGYETSEFDVIPCRTDTRHNVVMHRDAAMLDEVVVKGSISIRQTEKTMYFPTEAQRKSTNSGRELLYCMMMPELKVDSKTGTATTNDGRAVTRCINGVEATDIDVKALQPSDIIRVDFYPIGTGRFAQYGAVVDFVVRRYDSGGYADIRTETRFLTPKGDYDVMLKQHDKHWNHTVVAGSAFADDHKSGSDSEERIAIVSEFVKYSQLKDCHKKDYSVYGAYSALYTTDIATLKLSVGMTWNRTPQEKSQSTVSFSPALFASTRSAVSQKSDGLSPNISANMNIKLSTDEYLELNARYRYSHSNYERLYGEYDETDILLSLVTDAESRSSVYGGSVYYTSDIKDFGNITVGMNSLSEIYRTRYEGDTDSRQKLSKWNYTLHAGYNNVFWKKLMLSLRVNAMRHYANINDTHDSKWLFMPNVSLSYNGGKAGNLMFNWQTNYVNPPIEWKSELSQRVNQYEILRGNDRLPHHTMSMFLLSYTNGWKYMDINVYAASMLSSKSIRDAYLIEDNSLVHTYDVRGSYFQALFGSQATVYALDRHLQVSGSLTYNVRKLNNVSEDYFNDVNYTVNALYNTGNFSFSAHFYSPLNVYGITSSPYYKFPARYGAAVSYTYGRWFASVETANFLGERRYDRTFVTESNYQSESKAYNSDYYGEISLKVSYSLDFGHKKLNREHIDIDRTINSGIMRMDK